VREILKKTGNLPQKDFFIQMGGGASGIILLPSELNQPLNGVGSIIVYDTQKTNPRMLGLQWAEFFIKENCGKCAPCREGIFRLKEIFPKKLLIFAKLKKF